MTAKAKSPVTRRICVGRTSGRIWIDDLRRDGRGTQCIVLTPAQALKVAEALENAAAKRRKGGAP